MTITNFMLTITVIFSYAHAAQVFDQHVWLFLDDSPEDYRCVAIIFTINLDANVHRIHNISDNAAGH